LASSDLASAANGSSARLRAPCSHHTSRPEPASASAFSIASTGVAPTPALISSTGAAPGRTMKVPRGAATASWSPGRTWSCTNWLAAPCCSRFTLIR
jgi:hypothetical protein